MTTTHGNTPVVNPTAATVGDEGDAPSHPTDGRNARPSVGASGVDRAAANRDPWTWYPALEALKQLAATGETFECFDLTDRFGVYLDNPARYGALFSAAAHAGLIEHVGFSRSRRPSRAGGLTRTWRGTDKARARGRATP